MERSNSLTWREEAANNCEPEGLREMNCEDLFMKY